MLVLTKNNKINKDNKMDNERDDALVASYDFNYNRPLNDYEKERIDTYSQGYGVSCVYGYNYKKGKVTIEWDKPLTNAVIENLLGAIRVITKR